MILTPEQIAFNRERLAVKHSLHPDMIDTILNSHEELRALVDGKVVVKCDPLGGGSTKGTGPPPCQG
jgi:hypothetical protein